MATDKMPNVVVNVRKDTEDFWWEFTQVCRGLGLPRGTALKFAAEAWLKANTAPDGTPQRANPFA